MECGRIWQGTVLQYFRRAGRLASQVMVRRLWCRPRGAAGRGAATACNDIPLEFGCARHAVGPCRVRGLGKVSDGGSFHTLARIRQSAIRHQGRKAPPPPGSRRYIQRASAAGSIESALRHADCANHAKRTTPGVVWRKVCLHERISGLVVWVLAPSGVPIPGPPVASKPEHASHDHRGN